VAGLAVGLEQGTVDDFLTLKSQYVIGRKVATVRSHRPIWIAGVSDPGPDDTHTRPREQVAAR